MEEDNMDLDNEFQEDENEHQEQNIKKINPILKNNKKYNSKSQKKSNLILGTERDYNSNPIINTKYIYRPSDLSYFSKFSGFFNKNFNLTSFKKEREESRSLSKSPIYSYPQILHT